MGKKLASVAHLKILIREAPKSEHGLVLSDVSPVDRQNFKSLEKCMRIRTRNALRRYVPDSEATEFFLKLCYEVTSSLMDHDITPYERIEMIFHAIFFLRIWRKWILKSNYVLRENFITSNAYLCIELNAANLLKLIRIFRNEEKPELFLTTLFDSQACERAFRQLRSMGTPNFTKINFTLYELLHMVRRLEVQNDILFSKLSGLDIKLPKLEKKRETTKIYALPTEDEIKECLKRAKRFAVDDALQFGMEISPDDIDSCEIPLSNRLDISDEQTDLETDHEDESDNGFADDISEHDVNEEFLGEEEEDQHRAFVQVTDHSGKQQAMRKSTFVWLLSEGTKKISSDRLVRVQERSSNSTTSGLTSGTFSEQSTSSLVHVSRHIKIGDWCFFSDDSETGRIVYIGLIHALRFANHRLVKDKTYKFDSVNLIDKPNLVKELEVLSTWYFVNDKAVLIPAKTDNHSFICLEKYIATILVRPTIDPDTRTLSFNQYDFKEIESEVLKYIE